MTVIAYRDGVLAADRRIHNHNVATWGTMTKIARSPAGTIGGSCGQPALIFRFANWLRNGGTGPFDTDGERDWEGFVISPQRMMTAYDHSGTHPINGPYLVVGSGKEVAYGALFVGASAEDAVRAAIAHHAECGDGIDVLRLDESLFDVNA